MRRHGIRVIWKPNEVQWLHEWEREKQIGRSLSSLTSKWQLSLAKPPFCYSRLQGAVAILSLINFRRSSLAVNFPWKRTLCHGKLFFLLLFFSSWKGKFCWEKLWQITMADMAHRSLWLQKSSCHWILDFPPARNTSMCCVWRRRGRVFGFTFWSHPRAFTAIFVAIGDFPGWGGGGYGHCWYCLVHHVSIVILDKVAVTSTIRFWYSYLCFCSGATVENCRSRCLQHFGDPSRSNSRSTQYYLCCMECYERLEAYRNLPNQQGDKISSGHQKLNKFASAWFLCRINKQNLPEFSSSSILIPLSLSKPNPRQSFSPWGVLLSSIFAAYVKLGSHPYGLFFIYSVANWTLNAERARGLKKGGEYQDARFMDFVRFAR